MKSPLHVLTIEDDADDADFLSTAFAAQLPGTHFSTCCDGQAAIDFLHESVGTDDCPDLVFLDLHMPGLSGHQVLAELKALPSCSALPIVVMSTSLLESEAQKCQAAGCAAYFSKPISIEAYDDVVQAAIGLLQSSER